MSAPRNSSSEERLRWSGCPCEIQRYGHDRIEGRVTGPGVYPLAVRWTPYLNVEEGPVRLERVGDDGTRLIARSAGRFVLDVGLG